MICCGKPMRKNGLAESGRQRWHCNSCKRRTTRPDEEPGGVGYDEAQVNENAHRLREAVKGGCKRFVVTCAVNNAAVHQGFAALKTYCDLLGALLVVLPVSYKNISLYTASQEYRKRWSAELEQYLVRDRVHIGGGVEIAGDIPIAATAVNPLEGLGAIGGNRWQIVGHPQQGMRPVATPANERPKRVYSTGACTTQSYSRTKVGAKGAFYHTYGAVVVEVLGQGTALVRQIGLHGDSFHDIAGGTVHKYTPSGSEIVDRVETLTVGDEHVRFISKSVKSATYGPGGMVERLKPKYIVRHDVLDGYAGSHHHRKNPLVGFAKHHSGANDYASELLQVVQHINETTPHGVQTVMVASNHHDHLAQWINSTNVNDDHKNAIVLAELQLASRKAILNGQNPDPLRLYCEGRVEADVRWLGRDERFLVRGVDHSQHGDVGANGGRGSPKTFAQSTYKMTVGHSHSPSIEKGCYTVGKSTGRLEYERGLSTHANAHCLLYPDGKRTLIDIDRGRWFLDTQPKGDA